jgi:hypothetical protein
MDWTKGPTPQDGTGKYVVVWEKVEGNWKLAADIWTDGKYSAPVAPWCAKVGELKPCSSFIPLKACR